MGVEPRELLVTNISFAGNFAFRVNQHKVLLCTINYL